MNILILVLILLLSLLFPGVIGIVKAKIVGRMGPVLLQPFYDIIRLFKKGSVYSNTTSFVFQWAPIISFGCILVAAMFIPLNNYQGIFSFDNDLVVFAYLLAAGKFLMILAALDTGSGFEGMGANREAFYSLLVEPAFFILMGSVALITDHTSFYDLFNALHAQPNISYMIAIIASYLLIQITMVENSRLPVDDPKTHLELTMVHEVMVLDYSGFDLALIQLSNGIKFILYGGLIANFIIPVRFGFWSSILCFIAIQLVFAVIVGFLESFKARNKLQKNPQWIITLIAVALMIFIAVLIFSEKII